MKQEQILEAAQKRFVRYGYAKVTMEEIASDLGISKASLYYYYSDKSGIFKIIVDRNFHEHTERVQAMLQEIPDVRQQLIHYIELRYDYFRRFLNLYHLRYANLIDMKPTLSGLRDNFLKFDTELFSRILTTGQENGLFRHLDVPAVTALLIKVMQGLHTITLKDIQEGDSEESHYQELFSQMKLFTSIFLAGIASPVTNR